MITTIKEHFKMKTENDIEKFRALTLFNKEPETIAWIKTYMKDGDVFYDVGANVGIYSLYAACLYPNMKIYAIEPHSSNYERIIENINLNNFKNIYPLRIAMGAVAKWGYLYSKDKMAGTSGHQLDCAIDEYGKEFKPFDKQLVHIQKIDDVAGFMDRPEWALSKLDIPFPNHIKIDVDGREGDILAGMMKTLDQLALRSVLIEINNYKREGDQIIDLFLNAGFSMANEYNRIENHSRLRRKGTDIENIIFTRPYNGNDGFA